ncbi:hypothetical protein ABK040_009352 [Willaertia magna]
MININHVASENSFVFDDSNTEQILPNDNRNTPINATVMSKIKKCFKNERESVDAFSQIAVELHTEEHNTYLDYFRNCFSATNLLFILFVFHGVFALACSFALLFSVGTFIVSRSTDLRLLQTKSAARLQFGSFIQSMEVIIEHLTYIFENDKNINLNNPIHWFNIYDGLSINFRQMSASGYLRGTYDDAYFAKTATQFRYGRDGILTIYNVSSSIIYNTMDKILNESNIYSISPTPFLTTKQPWYLAYSEQNNTKPRWTNVFLNIANERAVALTYPLYINQTINSLPSGVTSNFSYPIGYLDINRYPEKLKPEYLYGVYGLQLHLTSLEESLSILGDSSFIVNSSGFVLVKHINEYDSKHNLFGKVYDELFKGDLLTPLLNCNGDIISSNISENATTYSFDFKQYKYSIQIDYLCDKYGLSWAIVVMVRTEGFLTTVVNNEITSLIVFIVFFILSTVFVFILLQIIASVLKRISKAMLDLVNLRGIYGEEKKHRSVFFDIWQIENAMRVLRRAFKIFSKILHERIVKKILLGEENYDQLFLTKEYTTLMTVSLKGFHNLGDILESTQFSSISSEYFTILNDIIQEHYGITYHRIAENSLSIFNQSVNPLANHEIHACFSALDLSQTLMELNKKHQINIVLEIGIHCGDVFIGNLGTSARMNLSCIGQNVTIATNLLTLCHHFNTNILISERIYQEVKDIFICYFVDYVVVEKQENTITPVYQLVERRTKGTDIQFKIERDLLTIQRLFYEKKFHKMSDICLRLSNLQDIKIAGHLYRRAIDLQNSVFNKKE